jgi:predicted enzyme related to lactoylglutathione lyase
MPERSSYQQGEFCWSDMGTQDLDAMVSFYTTVFGWNAENVMPPEAPVKYFMMRRNGKDVTAIGWKDDPSPQTLGPYISVEDADATAARAKPFDIFDNGRMAVLQDPMGSIISLWEAGTGIGATLRDEPGAMCWFELNTSDHGAARDFYTGLFGYTIDDISDETMTYNVLLLESLPEGQRSVAGIYSSEDLPKGWTVCFAVDDADAHVERARSNGGKMLSEPVDSPYGRYALLQDPNGATFSVMKMAWMPAG